MVKPAIMSATEVAIAVGNSSPGACKFACETMEVRVSLCFYRCCMMASGVVFGSLSGKAVARRESLIWSSKC